MSHGIRGIHTLHCMLTNSKGQKKRWQTVMIMSYHLDNFSAIVV
jgi:hypothetical protein